MNVAGGYFNRGFFKIVQKSFRALFHAPLQFLVIDINMSTEVALSIIFALDPILAMQPA